jgi:hypothetical protein
MELNEKEESGERFGQIFLDHLPELSDVYHQYHASHPLVTSLIPRYALYLYSRCSGVGWNENGSIFYPYSII